MSLSVFDVFMVFYAIFWGSVAGVQGRWKAFQLPLASIPRICRRVILSMLLLNLLPLIFFGYVYFVLNGKNLCSVTWIASIQVVVIGILPASAVFGFYRLWLGIIEVSPDKYYYKAETPKRSSKLKEKYWHVEPVYLTYHQANFEQPYVYLGFDSGKSNILWAICYIVIAALVPWLPT